MVTPKMPKTGFQAQLSLNAGQKYCRMLQIKLPFFSLLMMNERNRKRHSVVERYNDRPLVKKGVNKLDGGGEAV